MGEVRLAVPGSVPALRSPRLLQRVHFSPGALDLKVPSQAVELGLLAKALGCVWVVVDSGQGTGLGAEDTADTSRHNAGVRTVRDISGAAVSVVHNAGWDPTRGRGSTLLPNLGGLTRHFTGDPEGLRVLKLQKGRDGPRGEPLGFKFHRVVIGTDEHGQDVTSGLLVPADLPAEQLSEAADLMTRCLRILDAAPGQTQTEIAVALGIKKDKAGRMLRAMEAGDDVTNLGTVSRGVC